MSRFLVLRLEGVLQSWGIRSRFDPRDSSSLPTKSGVIGLIACAMGCKRGDPRIVALDQSLRMGVRADRIGRLMVDYQTVTGERGYLFNAAGKKRVGEPTLLVPHEYLEDACFTVALSGDDELLQQCTDALSAPHWQMYLGRKSCVPERPVFEAFTKDGDYMDLQQILEMYPLCKRHDKSNTFRCEIEDVNGATIRADAIRTSGIHYDLRRVRLCNAMIKGG